MDIEETLKNKVQIHLTLEFSLSGRKINEVEADFKEVFDEVTCKSLGKYIEQREKTLIFNSNKKDRQICRMFKNRHLKLSYGNVFFDCRQVRDKNGCHIPILKDLGIADKKQLVIDSYPEILARCAYAPFRKAQAGIKNKMSLGSVHNMFQDEIQKCRQDELECLKYLSEMGYCPPEPMSGMARVMDDGIFIRRRTIAGRGKGQKQDKRHHMEVQMTRCDFYDNDKDCWSYPPCVYASIEPSKEHIRLGKTYLDVHTGLSRVQSVIHISDAKANGKRHCRQYNENSHWQLDWYHLSRHVSVLHKIDENWKQQVWDLIEVEKLDEAISCLKNGLDSMKKYTPPICASDDYGKKTAKWWTSRIKEVEDLIGYLKNNRDGIYGVKSLVGIIPGERLPFGSGPQERLGAILVAHRMKGHGKAWKQESASNMLWLISREFQSLPKNKEFEQARDEALWWKELQDKPVISSCKQKTAGKVKADIIYPQSASLPILEKHQTHTACYAKLKRMCFPGNAELLRH